MKLKLLMATAAVLLAAGCGGPSLEHFWDGYDFSSQDGLEPMEEAEKRFGAYMELLEKTDTATAAASIRDFLDRAAADTVSYYVYSDLFISALYPLDSPYRNADLLRIYLQKAMEDGIAGEYLRFDESELLRKSRLNQPGAPASDGDIILADGSSAGILDLVGEAPQTLLVLVGQAGCRSCAGMMQELESKASRRTRLIAVVGQSRPGEAAWLRDRLSGRWIVGTAGESFLENWDFGLAPARYTISRSGKIKSLE